MPTARLAMLCNSYHRGGIERFMADLALAWAGRGGECWLVLPKPERLCLNAGRSQLVASVLSERRNIPSGLHVVEPHVGSGFEFGTGAYRASAYASAQLDRVPAGVPVITSDDPPAWRAACWAGRRSPAILVIHGDHRGYYKGLGR